MSVTSAVSEGSPEAAMRMMGPEAHMMALTSSTRLSALRNLVSANSSFSRHCSTHSTVRLVAAISL